MVTRRTELIPGKRYKVWLVTPMGGGAAAIEFIAIFVRWGPQGERLWAEWDNGLVTHLQGRLLRAEPAEGEV